MPLEGAVFDKPRQGILLAAGCRIRVEIGTRDIVLHQLPWKHHIADTDSRSQALAEGVHVDDPVA